MKIIKDTPNKNGAFPPIQDFSGAAPPSGYREISANADLSVFYAHNGFVLLAADESGLVTAMHPNLEAWQPWKAEQSVSETAERRTAKLAELSAACNAAILAGFSLTLPSGNFGHYTLEETDQINISTALASIMQGAAGFPYHADGELCRLFSAADIIALANAAAAHKLYHTTYHNHLKAWAQRAKTMEELAEIVYGAELPKDLKKNLEGILNAANG